MNLRDLYFSHDERVVPFYVTLERPHWWAKPLDDFFFTSYTEKNPRNLSICCRSKEEFIGFENELQKFVKLRKPSWI